VFADSNQSWTADQFDHAYVRVVAGTGKGQWGKIQNSTATAIQVFSTGGFWPVQLDTTSEYVIYHTPIWQDISPGSGDQIDGAVKSVAIADDFVACFQYKGDAESFRQRLSDRIEGFGLKLSEEKTQCINFGRFAREDARKRGEKPKEFTFLGFTHYSGKTKEGYFKVKRTRTRPQMYKEVIGFFNYQFYKSSPRYDYDQLYR